MERKTLQWIVRIDSSHEVHNRVHEGRQSGQGRRSDIPDRKRQGSACSTPGRRYKSGVKRVATFSLSTTTPTVSHKCKLLSANLSTSTSTTIGTPSRKVAVMISWWVPVSMLPMAIMVVTS